MIAAVPRQPVIQFIEEPHGYLVDGVPVPSWSELMDKAGLLPVIPPEVMPWVINAKHRGKQIHQAAAIIMSGQGFDPDELAPESLPYVQAFVDYWLKHKTHPVDVETPLYSAALGYCCTPDFHTRHAVYDLKTTDRPSRTWGIQTAAQALAAGAHTRRIVWLRPKLKTRNFEVIEVPDPRVFSEFDFAVVREVCAGTYDGPAITAWKALR